MAFKIATIISGFAVMILDQLSKYFINGKIPSQGFFLIQNSFWQIKFEPASNAFLAFGLQIPPLAIHLLLIAIIVCLIILLIKSWQNSKRTLMLLLGLIISAAISNFIDRLRLGAVQDFISLTFGNFNWPIFNLADGVIVVAAISLLVYILKNKIE